MLVVPKITRKLLTNGAYGAPPFSGPPNVRRMTPTALACIHITANDPPVATATQERDNVNNNQPGGPSASHYIDRNGDVVEAILWRDYPAWSNGDVKNPMISVPGIQKVIDARAKGFNANECYGVEIENCGFEPGYPITASQIRSSAYLVALAKLEWPELPISTATVHGHRYLNTVDKGGCPTRGDLEDLLGDVIRVAKDYFEVMELMGAIAEQNAIIAARDERISSLLALSTAQGEQIDTLRAALAQSEQGRADALGTVIQWEEYGEEVTSRAGGILGLDRPGARA